MPGTRCEARSDASKQGAQIGAWHEWYCTPVVATCRQTVEALLAPLSTAWQRMATIWQRMDTIWQRMDTGRAKPPEKKAFLLEQHQFELV